MPALASTTAVDLSRLPPPAVVEELAYETILAAMLADLQARDPAFDALTESDPALKILQVCAYREMILRQRVNEAARAVMVAHALGPDLDNLGALVGVGRLELAPADPESGAPAQLESDADFRRRIVLAPEGFSVAGPASAYLFHALSASGDVLDAAVESPEPGHVLVTILSRLGDGTAAAGLLDTVAAALSASTVRPLTDLVTVQSAVIVPFDVEAVLHIGPGPDSSVVLAAANARLDEHLAQAHLLGRGVALSGLYAALHVEGVSRVELIAPVADVACDPDEAAWCASREVTLAV